MSGRKIYLAVCEADHQREVIESMTTKQLRKLAAFLLQGACMTGFRGDVLAMVSTENLHRLVSR